MAMSPDKLIEEENQIRKDFQTFCIDSSSRFLSVPHDGSERSAFTTSYDQFLCDNHS